MQIITEVDTRGFDAFVEESIEAVEDPKLKRRVGRAIVFKFLELVIPRTPVDTGRVRSAWTVAAGKVAGVKGLQAWIEDQGKGDIDEQTKGRSEGEFKESMARGTYSAVVTNGVPYVAYLELGSSQQAPSGFVRITLREIAKEAGKDAGERMEAALRVANIKARREIGLKQGLGSRNYGRRANLRRR